MVPLIISIFILLIILLAIDFSLGKRMDQKNPPVFNFGKQQASYQLFTTGDSLFASLFKEIKSAKKHIDIMFFIVRNDEISKQMYELLKTKAEEGVTVRLLVDRIGSLSLKKKIIKDLKDSGVHFLYSDKPSMPYYFYKLNRRNHRKISIIDDKIGFVGGFNVGKEYIGKDPKLGPWRDYHLRIVGDALTNLRQVFEYDWGKANGRKRPVETEKQHHPSKQSTSKKNSALELVVTEGGQLEDKFVDWIHDAKSEILIGTPYFIPTKRMFSALLSAIERGVEVNLLIPKKADHPLVQPAAFPYLRQFLKAGGKGFLFTNGFYHAKVMIIDEKFCDVGTANFDMRSALLNKEVNTLLQDNDAFIKDIRSAFLKDKESAELLTEQWISQQPLRKKASGVVAKLVKPLL